MIRSADIQRNASKNTTQKAFCTRFSGGISYFVTGKEFVPQIPIVPRNAALWSFCFSYFAKERVATLEVTVLPYSSVTTQ